MHLYSFIFISNQIHLFDIDVPGKIRFQESETLSPGNSLSMFETRECVLQKSCPCYQGIHSILLLIGQN